MTQKYDEPLKTQVTLTLDIRNVDLVDKIRDNISRSAWINDAITYMLAANKVPYDDAEHAKNLQKINNAQKGKYP